MRNQRHWAIRGLTACFAVVIAVSLGVGASQSERTDKSTTQATMRGIFVTLSTAYHLSLDQEAFADAANRGRIKQSLEALVENTDELEDHGGGLDASFDYLRRSLSRDARDAAQRFDRGNYVGARFVLGKITENCVTCHTKLPAGQRFDLGAKFMEDLNAKELPPTARVNIEVATRQFDAALNTYEEILRDPDMSAPDMVLFGVFEAYLRIAIGALSDTKRPVAVFEALVRRDDMPKNVKHDATQWIEDLGNLELDALKGKELDTAREMIEHAKVETGSRSDRAHLVDFVASITLLHRFLKTGPTDALQLAETYYLLGVAESYVSRSYWISETDFLLEKAIRQAPQSEIAKKAYAFLVDYTKSGYKVAPARSVPPELQANLDELRGLIEN